MQCDWGNILHCDDHNIIFIESTIKKQSQANKIFQDNYQGGAKRYKHLEAFA